MIRSIFLVRYGLDLNNEPIFLAILFSVYLIWSFHVRFSSRKTPKNFIDSDRLISLLSFRRTKGILSFLLGLWKHEYFVFVTSRDNSL